MPHQKCPFPQGSGPHLLKGCLGPRVYPKRYFDWFCRFYTGHLCAQYTKIHATSACRQYDLITLSDMCQAMERTGRIVTISEPISPSIVGTKHLKLGDLPEIRQLARDVIRWECRPYPTIQPPPLAYFIKIISPTATAIPLFR